MTTLDQKIVVFEELEGFDGIRNELCRGGLEETYMDFSHDYAHALEIIRIGSIYGVAYPAAILHCNLSENPDKVDSLHRALRKANPHVDIYHAIAGGAGSLRPLIDAGVLSLNVKGILPLSFGGPAERNYLCELGKELQAKYFTPHG